MEPFRLKEPNDTEGLTTTGALIEINNLLAVVQSPFQINPLDIESICQKFNTDNTKNQLAAGLTSFYKQYLIYCLSDKKLSQDEIKYLGQLKRIFLLSDKTVKELTNEVISKIYLKELSSALEDGVLTSDEAVFLVNLKKDLLLDNDTAEQLYEKATRNYLDKQIEIAMEDQLLTDEEEDELTRISENLNISMVENLKTKELLEKYRVYWLIENGELPVILGQIPFNPKEECHYLINDVLWYEEENAGTMTPQNRYTMRRKINKVLESALKNEGLQNMQIDDFSVIEKGTLYFSNKQIYFQGEHNGMFLEYDNIAAVEPYQDGVELMLTSGSKHLFQFNDRIDIVCLLLNRLVYH